MATRAARNNILAGSFVLGAIILGVWVSFFLSNRPKMGGMRRFTIRFAIADGATGLKNGSPVQLAGQQIGRVRTVSFFPPDAPKKEAVDVDVEVRGDITLYENAGVYLQLPLLGTLSSINISSVGSEDAKPYKGASPAIEESEVVIGHIAPPGFLAQAGFGSEQAAELRESIKDLESTIKQTSDLLERNSPKVDAALTDAQKLVSQLKTSLTAWSKDIDETAANIRQASSRLDPMLTKVDSGIDDAKAAIKDIRGLIDENRDRLSQIVKNVESATGKIDQTTIDQVNAVIKQGSDALAMFSDSLGSVSTIVKEEGPGLRHTLANLRLMSDQLKLTAIEVRSQPWRLLHSPTTKEFSTQVLYDATRAYAEAASDLRAASEALQAVGNKEGSQEMVEQLSKSVEKYKKAESALMNLLIGEEKK